MAECTSRGHPDRLVQEPRRDRRSPFAPAVSHGKLIPVTVHFDDLDALGLLHNARYPLLVERA